MQAIVVILDSYAVWVRLLLMPVLMFLEGGSCQPLRKGARMETSKRMIRRQPGSRNAGFGLGTHVVILLEVLLTSNSSGVRGGSPFTCWCDK